MRYRAWVDVNSRPRPVRSSPSPCWPTGSWPSSRRPKVSGVARRDPHPGHGPGVPPPDVGRGGGRRAPRPHHQGGGQGAVQPRGPFEVEVQGDEYVILRERDIHAVASERIDGGTGLYL